MSDAAAPAPARKDSPYSWYVVGVLILAYTVSYIDRTMLTLLVGPIRETLNVSDLQISLLHGLAFAVFYTFLGIPLGRLADRSNRRNLIIAGAVVWSAATAFCGLSRSFLQMFLARIMVGVGEATLSPCAYSMLGDYFTPKTLTRALSVYTAAMYIGAGLALVFGGALIGMAPAIGGLEPWQVVFIIVGLPGFFVAALMLTVKEPVRTALSSQWAQGVAPGVGAVVAYVRQRWAAYACLIGGFSIFSLMWNGAQAWIPAYLMRSFGWTAPQVGLSYGVVLLVFGTAGITFGGWLAGRLRARGVDAANLWVGVIASLLIVPFGVGAALAPSAQVALILLCGFVFMGSMPFGAAAGALQEITPNQMRAQMAAVYLFGINLAGIGAGPTVTAFFTDKVFGRDDAVNLSIAATVAIAAPLAALVLWLGAKPYRAALARSDFQ